jgi:hypothetical protein
MRLQNIALITSAELDFSNGIKIGIAAGVGFEIAINF